MKTIHLTESQFIRLMESNGISYPNYEGGDLKEFPGSEVFTTCNVTNSNGELEYGKPVDTDDVQDDLTIQNYWAATRTGSHTSPF